MEEQLTKITGWVGRGTLRQFRNEVKGNLADSEYTVEVEGDALRFYRTHKEGGFLGIGAKTIKELVLEVTREGNNVEVSSEPRDPEFIQYLAGILIQH
jgi:hypothetical protein